MCHFYLSPTVLQYPIFPACTARTCFGRCITAKVTQADRKLACNFVCEARFLTTNASARACARACKEGVASSHLPADFMFFLPEFVS